MTLEVRSREYSLAITRLTETLRRGVFTETVAQRSRRTLVFPEEWRLARLQGTYPGQVVIFANGRRYEVTDRQVLFLPAYAVLRYELGPPAFRIETLTSTRPAPPWFPREAMVFETGGHLPPDTPSVEALLGSPGERLLPGPAPSSVSRRAKEYLDAHFRDPITIGEMARHLRFSREVLTREFTRDYGLAPASYRNTLRVFEAMRRIAVEQHTVTEAGLHSGFSDSSTFNRSFRRLARVAPSAYRPPAGTALCGPRR